jgi:hypothetical protein
MTHFDRCITDKTLSENYRSKYFTVELKRTIFLRNLHLHLWQCKSLILKFRPKLISSNRLQNVATAKQADPSAVLAPSGFSCSDNETHFELVTGEPSCQIGRHFAIWGKKLFRTYLEIMVKFMFLWEYT